MNRIFPPQGSLGDCFVLAGAANYFSQNSDHLYFPILNRGNQYETVKCLFKDNPKITVIGFVDPHYSDLNEFIILNQLDMIPVPDILSVDINGVVTQPIWDEQHYTLFDIPFKYRYSKFQMPAVDQEAAELFEKTVTQSRYILASKKYGSAN